VRELRIVIPGKIVPKGRPRLDRRHGRLYTPAATVAYEGFVRDHISIMAGRQRRESWPYLGPVEVEIIAWLLKPKRTKHPDHPAGKPDLDNIVKVALDAITGAGVWKDDAQVVAMDARKVWTEEAECLWVTIIPYPA